ncbi:MFS domain-containing protein [Mycena sanguinolenta]|uniref:MFS domain-containing protein n=1 Tax=Mycena sanguinolenta TaxID=230812 RepID=A0A8H6YFV4_9AGAR|nr:MFS domain-containing protein [Mycena sanguinolenta]
MATTEKPSSSTDLHAPAHESLPDSEVPQKRAPKSRAFWLSFVALMFAVFLAALDLTAVATALPTIADALNDTRGDYIWVGSAYALSSTAFIPLSGNLADVFGRKSVMLASVAFFVVGSAVAGASQNMSMMIAARSIQGVGGGGILTLSEIITSDLVPLAERGLYQGLLALIWALACYSGPPIGGGLSQNGKSWRWLFYLNLPIGGIAFALVLVFLSVKKPEGSTRDKLAKVDWVGNAIVIVGTGLANVGLSWAGTRYSWSSVQVLAPLVIGLILLIIFAVYEAKFAQWPAVPGDIVGNRTSLSALLVTIAHGIISIGMIFYLPGSYAHLWDTHRLRSRGEVFFQACFGASPLRSAVDFLPAALTTTPFGFFSVVCITMMKKYRVVNWTAWAISVVGFGVFSTIREDTSTGKWVGYQIICAMGVGPLFGTPMFPLLAPLPNTRAASALALFSFTRAFSQTWGITISSTILQNMLKKKLPAAFVSQFPPNLEIAYAAIPLIRQLEEPLRTQVRAAFADSMAVIWQTMIGFAGLGLIMSLLMKEVPMATTVDETYALKEKDKKEAA